MGEKNELIDLAASGLLGPEAKAAHEQREKTAAEFFAKIPVRYRISEAAANNLLDCCERMRTILAQAGYSSLAGSNNPLEDLAARLDTAVEEAKRP